GFRTLFFSGEPGAGIPATKRLIEETFGGRCVDMGSMAEMTPWMTNAECRARTGMHLWQDLVYTQVCDPGTFAPQGPGAEGTPVYTHLERTSQPMIRLVSGDLARWTDASCPCGRRAPGEAPRHDDRAAPGPARRPPRRRARGRGRAPAHRVQGAAGRRRPRPLPSLPPRGQAVTDDVDALARQVVEGSPRAAARALTWVESGGPRAEALAARLYRHTGRAHVVGITGAPGS